MSKIIYDVIQRFEVENGVPRLISTNIQVIQGGEDLMSLATSMLEKLGFYDKFEENRTSQYIGYRLKNPGKGAKRYQLVLAQRKEGLCISIPQEILEPYLLKLNFSIEFFTKISEFKKPVKEVYTISTHYWIIPSKNNIFIELSEEYGDILNNQVVGEFEVFFDELVNNIEQQTLLEKFELELYQLKGMEIVNKYQEYVNKYGFLNALDKSDCCLKIGINDTGKDKLFPYTRQVCISSRKILEEFLSHFAKILMEQQ